MADQTLDPRLELLLRGALKAEAARLPLTITAEQIVNRAVALQGRRAGKPRHDSPALPWRNTYVQRFVGLAVVVVVGSLALGLYLNNPHSSLGPQPSPSPSASPTLTAPPVDLGIFKPISGWIVYGNDAGMWGDNPNGPDVKLGAAGTPLAWSNDGTRLLLRRNGLVVLNADGSETQLTGDRVADTLSVRAATISPDGSRVVFATIDGPRNTGFIFSVDADGGSPEVLLELDGLEGVTFSPDGTRIAYVSGHGDAGHRVSVMDGDGSNRREIVANDVTLGTGHYHGFAWSPAGDRIALGLEGTIYTFAPDGSGFTPALLLGAWHDDRGPREPFWSPDGSQLETTGPWHPGEPSAAAQPTATGPDSPPSTSATTLPPTPSGRLGHIAYVANGELFVADWDGANAKRIFSPDQLPNNVPKGCRTLSGGPEWSPDGRRLAIRTEWNDACSGLVLITEADGSALTTIVGNGWNIGWSPDSTRIVTWVETWQTIGVYGVDGERQALLPAPRSLMSSGDHDPSWTPDGTEVLVPDGVVVPLGGSPPYVNRWLAFPPSLSRISPDGTTIAHVDALTIVVASTTDGSGRRVLSSLAPAPARNLEWSPAGDRIGFDVSGSVPRIVEVASGRVTTLSLPDGALREVGDEISFGKFSPEGDRVMLMVYHAADRSLSLWSVQADGSDAQELLTGTTVGDWQRLLP